MTNVPVENTMPMTFDLTCTVPHCPVVLVLDTSHSMWGEGLADMKASLKTFYKTIGDVQFFNSQMDIAAVSMGDNLCMLEEFTPMQSSDLPNRSIRPKGDTPIGAALEMALQALQTQRQRYQAAGVAYVTPNLILLSDEKSTDDFHPAAEMIHRAVTSRQLICRAIALGPDADMQALAMIAGKEYVSVPNYGGMRQTFAQIGQIVSQTYEEEAQEVMKESVSPVETVQDVTYLLDGTNILHWDEYRSGITLRYLLAITDYLKKENRPFQVFFDATTPHILRKSAPAEAGLYETLLKNGPGQYCQVPAGTRADDFLLLQADMNPNALILTQDRFRDHEDSHAWLKTEKRVIPGMVMNDIIFFPQISLQISTAQPKNEDMNCL